MERKNIGRYVVERKLGQGGMGVVYKAYDPILDRVVAIKLMSAELSRDDRLVKRFLREARISAKLDHPHIIKVYDLGQDGPNYYLVMEYIDGSTLRAYLQSRKNIDLKESLRIFSQILEAMNYAHSKGVVHRDLKPENIMLTREGNVKVMDFGLAFIKGSHSITSPGSVMGTLAYFSPEQAQGLEVDHRTDIYALGVILFELITGQLPIIADNPAAMIHKLLTEQPPSPAELNPQVPPKLGEITLRALAKSPEERYPSTAMFLAEIREIYNDMFNWDLLPLKELEKLTQPATSSALMTPSTTSTKPSTTPQTSATQQRPSLNLTWDALKQQKKKVKLGSPSALQKLKRLRDIISDSQTLSSNAELTQDGIRCKICGAISPPGAKYCKNCGAPLQAEIPINLGDLLERAKELYSEERYDEVVSLLQPHIAAVTDKKLIYVFIRALMKLKRYEEALSYLEPKLEIVRSNRLLELAGDISYHLKEYQRAAEYYEKLFLRTNEPDVLYKLAKATMKFNRERALKLFEKLLEMEPSYTKAKRYLAELCMEVGDLPRAVVLLQDYIRDFPDDAKAYITLGNLYMELGKMSEVYKLYMNALGMRIEDPKLLYQIARYYLEIDKKREALELLERVIELEPDNRDAANEGYLLARSLNEPKLAAKFLERLIELDPDVSTLHFELAETYMALKEYDKAIREYRRALELSPGDLEIAMKLGDALVKAGRYAEAKELFSQLYALDHMNPKVLEKLSIVTHLMGDTDEAIKYLEEAVALEPSNLDYVKGLAKMLRDAGRLEDAARYLKAVVEEQPNDPVANALLGEISLRQGLIGSATYHLKQAVRLDPSMLWAHELLIKAHLKRGDYQAAVDDIDILIAYLETKGDSEELYKWYYRKCELLVEQGREREALELAKLVLPRARGLYAYALKAFTLFHHGEPYKAIDTLKEALSDYMSKELLELIADYRIRIGEYFKAWKYAEKLVEMEPKNPRYYFLRGLINFFLSSYGQAAEDLEMALRLGESREDLYHLLANAYLKLGRYSEVMKLLGKTKLSPELRYYLFLAYRSSGQEEEAARHLQELLKEYPALTQLM